MTDDEDFLANLPTDPSNRAVLAAELNMIAWLVQNDGLTREGLRLAHSRINTPADVLAATGPLYELREHVNDALIKAMAAESGVAESYWRDRPLIAEHEEPEVVGTITALTDDQGKVMPQTAETDIFPDAPEDPSGLA